MKKCIALILAALLACAAVTALAESVSAGTWYLTELVMQGASMNPAALGLSMTLTLNEDGTATMDADYGDGPETEKGTWKATDNGVTIESESSPMDLVLEDGALKVDMGDGFMVFRQEAPEAAEPLPQVVTAESEEAFLGSWKLTGIGAGEVFVPAAAAGVEMTLVVEPGKVAMTSDEVTHETESTLEDGALKFVDASGNTLTLELNDNGWLSIPSKPDEEPARTMYFEKAE